MGILKGNIVTMRFLQFSRNKKSESLEPKRKFPNKKRDPKNAIGCKDLETTRNTKRLVLWIKINKINKLFQYIDQAQGINTFLKDFQVHNL